MADVGQRHLSFLKWLDEASSVSRLFGAAHGDAEFNILCKEYLELAALRNVLHRLGGILSSLPSWDSDLEAALQDQIEPVSDKLFRIASGVAEHEAQSLEQLEARSRLLVDLSELDRDDVVTRLTVALCRDLHVLTAAQVKARRLRTLHKQSKALVPEMPP